MNDARRKREAANKSEGDRERERSRSERESQWSMRPPDQTTALAAALAR